MGRLTIVRYQIVHAILQSATSNATVDMRFKAIRKLDDIDRVSREPPNSDRIVAAETEWLCSLEIMLASPLLLPGVAPEEAAPPPPSFTSPFAHTLLSLFGVAISQAPSDPGTRLWKFETRLPGIHIEQPRDAPAAILDQPRPPVADGLGQEPTTRELTALVNSSLKGTKVILHSGEQSMFAKYLTSFLASWGMDLTHVPLDVDESDTASTRSDRSWVRHKRDQCGPIDSGFAGGNSSAETPSNIQSPSVKSSVDASEPLPPEAVAASYVLIDDDVITLRRVLLALRPPMPLHLPSQLAKRPQLASRRSRSSPHVRQSHTQQQQNTTESTIILFSSLTQYRQVREVVQEVLATSRGPTLPHVIVVPKPASPRRVLTALYLAMRQTQIDPFLPPIATSPSSPGSQYWAPKLSPALAGLESEVHGAREGKAGSDPGQPRVRTPPVFSPSHLPHPPSPLGRISDEQVSYFSSVAQTLGGTAASQGMVVQSPDGRPAIFFQPSSKNVRVMPGRAASIREQRGEGSVEDKPRHEVAAPHDIGLGRHDSGSQGEDGSGATSPVPPPTDTPAMHLNSFISAARGTRSPEVQLETGELSSAPTPPPLPPQVTPAPATAQRQPSSPGSGASRPPSIRRNTAGSPKTETIRARGMTSGGTPPASPPVPQGRKVSAMPPTTLSREPSTSSMGVGQRRRVPSTTIVPGAKGRSRANTLKRTTPSVPPISVLIVEGASDPP